MPFDANHSRSPVVRRWTLSDTLVGTSAHSSVEGCQFISPESDWGARSGHPRLEGLRPRRENTANAHPQVWLLARGIGPRQPGLLLEWHRTVSFHDSSVEETSANARRNSSMLNQLSKRGDHILSSYNDRSMAMQSPWRHNANWAARHPRTI